MSQAIIPKKSTSAAPLPATIRMAAPRAKLRDNAIGTLGCTKNPVLREVFREGLPELVRRIEPSLVVVYGAIHEPTLSPVFEAGIDIVHFNCQTSIVKEAS